MVKKLAAVGSSPGIIIERPILELLGITKDSALEFHTDVRRPSSGPQQRGDEGLRLQARGRPCGDLQRMRSERTAPRIGLCVRTLGVGIRAADAAIQRADDEALTAPLAADPVDDEVL